MSKEIIKDETGIYVELPRDKIIFASKEAEIMFDLSMENDYLQQENQEFKKEINKISKKEVKVSEMLHNIKGKILTEERLRQIENVLFEVD